MEVFKRAKTWHCYEFINGVGTVIPRHSTKCRDRQSAYEYLKTLNLLGEWKGRKEARKKATPLPTADEIKKGPSLTEALETWLATLERATTKNHFRRVITTQFIAPLAPQGITHLGDVKTAHCRALHQGWRDKGLSLNTILNYRRPPNAMYNHWIKIKEADIKNPWTPVAILKEIKPTRRQIAERRTIDDGICTLPLDVDGDENWRAVRSSLVPFLRGREYQHPLLTEPERFLALIELLYETGLRRGDATQFQPDFIDANGHYHAVQYKTGVNVAVSLPAQLAAKLRALAPLPWRGDPTYPGAGRYIFWDGTGDADDDAFKKYMDNIIGRPLRELGKSLKISSLRPHRFRDSFAVNRLNEGMRMETLSQLLGHKSIKTTERYYCPKVLSRVRVILAQQAALRRPFLIAS